MTKQHLTASFTVDKTPEEAFAAINNVRGWWSGNIDGATDRLGAEWTYRYQDMHVSKQKIVELTPGKRVVWRVLDSYLSFVKDKHEWDGTTITFDIAPKGDKTEVTFTHVGLAPDVECYDACSNAWGSYIEGSLRNLIANGNGEPNRTEH
jgi:Activator of Hsp90 ATPase homolog 1-like protein